MAGNDEHPDYSALQAKSWEDMHTGPYAPPGAQYQKAAGARSKAEAQRMLMAKIDQGRTMDRARLMLQFHKPGAMTFPKHRKVVRGQINPNSGQAMYHYLTDVKGMKDAQARGVLANFLAESAWKPGGLNPDDLGKPAWGMAQWRGPRRKLLEKHVPDWQGNWQGQLDFMYEHDAPYDRRVLARYNAKDFKTPEDAAAWFTQNWERPKEQDRKNPVKGKLRGATIKEFPF